MEKHEEHNKLCLFHTPLCLSILLLLAMNDISSGQLMSLFLTVEEDNLCDETILLPLSCFII